jgi:hypothetical protein
VVPGLPIYCSILGTFPIPHGFLAAPGLSPMLGAGGVAELMPSTLNRDPFPWREYPQPGGTGLQIGIDRGRLLSARRLPALALRLNSPGRHAVGYSFGTSAQSGPLRAANNPSRPGNPRCGIRRPRLFLVASFCNTRNRVFFLDRFVIDTGRQLSLKSTEASAHGAPGLFCRLGFLLDRKLKDR